MRIIPEIGNAYDSMMNKPIINENSYNLIMKISVDDDSIMTMSGFSGYVWAGSLNGNVYVFRMDNYELYKTFAGHRDSVWCLCSMLDMYVVSGSAQNDTSIAIWETVQEANVVLKSPTAITPTSKGSDFVLQGPSNAPKRPGTTGDGLKSIDML